MSSLQYSSDALNVLSRFERADVVVYVEGIDDETFWCEIFRSFTDLNIKFIQAGGSEEIDKIIVKIATENAEVVVCRDSDYLDFKTEKVRHNRIIYTRGHSIENTLYCSSVIHRVAELWCRTSEVQLAECQNWLDGFSQGFESLVILDLANDFAGGDNLVLGQNCSRFMNNQSSSDFCAQKIQVHYEKACNNIEESYVDEAIGRISDSAEPLILCIRGHFLATGVLKYLSALMKKYGRNKKMNYEALFTMAIQVLAVQMKDVHPHLEYYRAGIEEAF